MGSSSNTVKLSDQARIVAKLPREELLNRVKHLQNSLTGDVMALEALTNEEEEYAQHSVPISQVSCVSGPRVPTHVLLCCCYTTVWWWCPCYLVVFVVSSSSSLPSC
jgi:hypothetical protein